MGPKPDLLGQAPVWRLFNCLATINNFKTHFGLILIQFHQNSVHLSVHNNYYYYTEVFFFNFLQYWMVLLLLSIPLTLHLSLRYWLSFLWKSGSRKIQMLQILSWILFTISTEISVAIKLYQWNFNLFWIHVDGIIFSLIHSRGDW